MTKKRAVGNIDQRVDEILGDLDLHVSQCRDLLRRDLLQAEAAIQAAVEALRVHSDDASKALLAGAYEIRALRRKARAEALKAARAAAASE